VGPQGFDLEATETPDGTLRVTVTGALDYEAAQAVSRGLMRARRGHANVVLDLSGVDFVDSSGVAMLLEAHADAAKGDWTLTVTMPDSPVRQRFAVRGLLDILPFADGPAGPRARRDE
jgi:anti-sigma B factor antagonist